MEISATDRQRLALALANEAGRWLSSVSTAHDLDMLRDRLVKAQELINHAVNDVLNMALETRK